MTKSRNSIMRDRYTEAVAVGRADVGAGDPHPRSEHPTTLLSVNNLAALYYSQGRLEDAESLLQRAGAP
jgi:hypothetical protein